jgi:hypothetical protein
LGKAPQSAENCRFLSGNLEEKRKFLQKIGSNFRLTGQKVACQLGFPWSAAAKFQGFPEWSCLYEEVRTYFKEKHGG